MSKKPKKTYSPVLKQYVVEQVLSGKMTSGMARRCFEIQGHDTVDRWIYRYNVNRNVYKDCPMPTKYSSKNQKELEAALEYSEMENAILKASIKIAKEELGMKLEKKMVENYPALSEFLKEL